MIVDASLIAPEVEYSQSLVGGGQGKAADCSDRMIDQSLREWKAVFQPDVVNDDRFLMLPNPTGDRTFHWDFGGRLPFCRHARFQKVAPHDVAGTIVKHHRETAKLEEQLQAASEIMKQLR